MDPMGLEPWDQIAMMPSTAKRVKKMQEPVTVVSTHLDVWAEMRRAWHGMVTRRDHRNSHPIESRLQIYQAIWDFRDILFSFNILCIFFRNFLPDFSQLGLFARVFCWFFQGILRHGGGWSHPAAGVRSPAPSPAVWWDVWWDVWWPCGHPGGFQYGLAEQRDPAQIWLKFWDPVQMMGIEDGNFSDGIMMGLMISTYIRIYIYIWATVKTPAILNMYSTDIGLWKLMEIVKNTR